MQSPPNTALVLTKENRLTAAYLLVALIALFVGVVTGFLQALEHAGINLYPKVSPLIQSYYHGLSLHGVMNVLVWTTFFISGFLTLATVHALKTPLQSMALGWAAFGLMIAGLLVTAIPLLGNQATVLFTFYPPMKAHVAFYLGLTLVVAATWLVALSLFRTYRVWRAQHPDEWTPLAAFMALITFAMWTIASLGIAAEMLFLLIPWSLDWLPGTDALLARTLFWFSGHPIVYFWLLPAYVSWYTMVPAQAGGRLFSDPMARVSFLLFLTLSIPVLVTHFLMKYAKEADPPIEGIGKDAMRLLLEYDWPGNVRELENVIERAVILGHGPQILPEDLPAHLRTHQTQVPHQSKAASPHRPTLEELERDYIATILRETHWHQMQAARILGIDRRTLYRKIRTYGFQPTISLAGGALSHLGQYHSPQEHRHRRAP